MGKKSTFCRKSLLILTSTVQLLFAPISVPFASAQSTDPAPTEPAQVTEPVVETPPPKYVYDPATGLWSNGTYNWDPATNTTSPVAPKTYSYNPDTTHWDTDAWVYDSATNSYIPRPATAVITNTGPGSTNSITDPIGDTTIANTGPNSTNQANTGTIDTTGPDSFNAINDQDGSNLFFAGFYDASISISLASTATSGDASVLHNTIGGNATSGDAKAYATIINMLQSAWGSGGTVPEFFSADIQGDYVGDLLINPQNLAVGNTPPSANDLTVELVETASIHNDIDLLATSGNATVSGNTSAGSANTGDATAVATVMNLINSSIAAQRSFIGVVNVYGNLEGDVLMPETLVDQLIASNVPTTQIQLPSDLTIANNTSYDIDNNISAQASSGNADVMSNTSAGGASSGQAMTNVTVFNITGQHIITENALLVFVNVMGEWVGFITNAPGATSAMLGCCSPSVSSSVPDSADYDIERTYSVTNDISVQATTGDAEVSGNTSAGSASSGDAYASANVMNMLNTNMSLSSWFGVLFLNIFGDWHGSFGTDTAYGGFSTEVPGGGTTITSPQTQTPTPTQVFVLSTSSSGQLRARPVASARRTSTLPPATPVVQEEAPADTLGATSEITEPAIELTTGGASRTWLMLLVFGGSASLLWWYVAQRRNSSGISPLAS